MSFLLPLLKSATLERHNRAVSGLNDGTLTVTLTKQSDHEIRATVKNGNGVTYGVHLGGFGSVCDCPDFCWRGSVPCKHAIAVAVFALQPHEESRADSAIEKAAPVAIEITHLQWRSGELLCPEPHPLRTWTWPWPMGIIAHQAQWPEVSLCQTCLQTWQHPMKEAA